METDIVFDFEKPKSYVDPDGNVWPTENVYYKVNGPHVLIVEEDGERIMTNIPLTEVLSDSSSSVED